GGIAHGIGNALFEWMGYDEAGQPVTTTFADYLLPTAREVPRLETIYRQTPSPLNPLGVKGVGEVGTIPAAAAVISAVEDALRPFAVRIAQVPLSPQTLLGLISAARLRQSPTARTGHESSLLASSSNPVSVGNSSEALRSRP